MPASSMKQYKVLTAALSNTPQTSVQAAPATPGRTLLFIQNTSGNPGLVHFKENVQGDASDIQVAAGAFLLFDQAETCPTEKINLGSAAAASWAILEQVAR